MAVDLGCGPGFTTRMLATALNAGDVYGLDASEDFLARAADLASECVFVRHDLMQTPFPVRAGIMYVRFVLSHLPEPVRLVNRWVRELEPDGLLLAEEVEDVETSIPVFNKYLMVNSALVASQGARLFVGGALSRGTYHAGVLLNECVRLPVRNCDAAAMFYPTAIGAWENEPYVHNLLSAVDRKKISGELRAIMDSGDERCGAVWTMRRIVLKNNQQDPYLEMFI